MKIDREIPWRIFADIRTKSPADELSFSTVIKNYIPEYTDNLQLFFDMFYNRVIPYDNTSYAYFEEFVNLFKSFFDVSNRRLVVVSGEDIRKYYLDKNYSYPDKSPFGIIKRMLYYFKTLREKLKG